MAITKRKLLPDVFTDDLGVSDTELFRIIAGKFLGQSNHYTNKQTVSRALDSEIHIRIRLGDLPVSERQLAKITGITQTAIKYWREEGFFPPDSFYERKSGETIRIYYYLQKALDGVKHNVMESNHALVNPKLIEVLKLIKGDSNDL